MMNLACRSCSSKRILLGIRVVSLEGSFFFSSSNSVSLEVPSDSLLGKPMRSLISADACIDCGHLELHAVDLKELQRLYATLAEPLGLDSRVPARSSEEAS
jgi:hypothetical protein